MGEREATQEWTVIAHLLRPQGRKGELLAELLTDFPERFRSHPEVHLARPATAATHPPLRPATITHFWLPTGRNHGRVVLTLAGVESISAAEALAGLDVLVADQARVELEEDAEYISDLVGCEVFDRGTPVGSVAGVDFPTTADGTRRLRDAAPLLSVLDAAGEEVLIPYVQQFLDAVDVANRRIDMSLPAGLIDLNRSSAQVSVTAKDVPEDPDAD